jgi:hypothetical protein
MNNLALSFISTIFIGLGTVLMRFFIMQPAFGLGFAASKTPNPTQARLRNLMNHFAFPGTARAGVTSIFTCLGYWSTG